MLTTLKRWNTLRNQILFIFLFVMIIVLLIVSLLTLGQVSTLLKNNAKKQIQQVAIEANGRIESLYNQINMASKLLITDEKVQEIITEVYYGKEVAFRDRQLLMSHINRIMGNTNGIYSFELFSDTQQRILPLDGVTLQNRIDKKWIEAARDAKGGMVWIGDDPNDKNYFLAIRSISLIEKQFRHGGFLLISIDRNHFKFSKERNDIDQYSILLDQDKNPIFENYPGDLSHIIKKEDNIVQIENRDYLVSKEISRLTGWTVIILTPVSVLTEGLAGIRTGIILSGVIGFIIFTFFSILLSTFITRPIIRLTKTMREARNGSLTLNPSVSSVNEINELNSTYNHLVNETNNLIQMVYQKELLRNQSELKALQAQINPHFLFNTLDALHWSLEEKDEDELAEIVIAMSNLFRYTITKDHDDGWVFLKDEIKHINDYMEIMKMRFGDRLQCHVSIPREYEFVKIPKLIIQPLVENAILHGAENKVGETLVSVIVEPVYPESKKRIRITVQDNGTGMDKERLEWIIQSMKSGGINTKNGKGMAISNVYTRLQLYYNDQLQTEPMIESELNKGTKFSFELPIDRGSNMYTKQILIVDDEPRTRQGLQRTLETWNNGEYSILTAESGEEVMRIAEEKKIHILLTDIQMPEMTGLQLLKEMKSKGMSPIVIIISAYSEFEYAQEALRLGVVNYLLKPFGKSKLIEAIEEAVTLLEKQERAGMIEKVVDEKIIEANTRMASTKDTIREAIAYIDQHLKEDISLKDIAAHVHLNPSYLSVLFKEQVNLTFSEYVTRRRIQRAKELVISTNLPISEIAEESGYKTSKYFIKIFKELEGMTPSAYRKTKNERAF